jgi:GTP-binding protein
VRQAPPTFLLFVNRDELFSPQYKKYLADSLRTAFGYEGCPIVLVPKPRPKTVESVRKFRPKSRDEDRGHVRSGRRPRGGKRQRRAKR